MICAGDSCSSRASLKSKTSCKVGDRSKVFEEKGVAKMFQILRNKEMILAAMSAINAVTIKGWQKFQA